MTFTAVVTAHAHDPSKILGNLIYQTRKPDEILCIYSDVSDIPRLVRDFGHVVEFIDDQNMNDWGHQKRALGLELALFDAVGFFNADDSYDSRYVELMMARLEDGADVAYCAWGIRDCTFAGCSSTSGNFVVRTDLARFAGWTDRDYSADAHFINRVAQIAHRVDRVDEVLYFHNVQ